MMFGRADIQGIKKVLQYVDIVGLVLFLTLFALGVPAERQGTEPKRLTAYKSVFYFPKFQIGNETITIFIDLFVRLCPLFVCLSHGFKDTTLF